MKAKQSQMASFITFIDLSLKKKSSDKSNKTLLNNYMSINMRGAGKKTTKTQIICAFSYYIEQCIFMVVTVHEGYGRHKHVSVMAAQCR